MYGSEISASCSEIRVVSRRTAGRPSGVSTPRPASTSSKIACETASRGPSGSVNSSRSAFSSVAPYARVVSGIEYPCMFAGQAPPFGWYWSASRSRASAPRARAILVTSPVAPGWFVEGHAGPGPLGREGGGEAGGSAADHEHVEEHGRGHDPGSLPVFL